MRCRSMPFFLLTGATELGNTFTTCISSARFELLTSVLREGQQIAWRVVETARGSVRVGSIAQVCALYVFRLHVATLVCVLRDSMGPLRLQVDMLAWRRSRGSDDVSDAIRQCGLAACFILENLHSTRELRTLTKGLEIPYVNGFEFF